MGSRREREEDYLRMRFRRVDDHEGQLDALRTHDTEEYNMVKIKLETDVQVRLLLYILFYPSAKGEVF